MKISIPYGRSMIEGVFPNSCKVDIIEAPTRPAHPDPEKAVRDAINSPLGDFNWLDYKHVQSVAIAINDKTRPVPHKYLIPPLLDKLAEIGIDESKITFYIAGGTHAPMPQEEFTEVLSLEILGRYRVVSHNSEDDSSMIYMGETTKSTAIWVNRKFQESELKIVVGNIEPHQFAGFSGGVKTAAIGLAGVRTINQNHSLMNDPASRLGEFEGNPTRQDIEEIGERIGVQFALNTILNQDRQIVHVLAGNPDLIMRTGVPLSRENCQRQVNNYYDLLIASPGGHPKDINLYQAQKALAHASLIIKPGGTIILAAACPEGTGSQKYEAWMKGITSFDEVLERFKMEGFRIGPHKAFMIARDASKVNLLFVSEMDPALAHSLLLTTCENLQNAIDIALIGVNANSRIGILPHASSTIPYLKRTNT